MIRPLIGMPGTWELVLIVLVIVLLFGAKKLPELARGTGQALRIFKTETKGLTDDDTDGERDRGTAGDGEGKPSPKSLGSSGPDDDSANDSARGAVAPERRDSNG